jgi:DDE superfamily endonuclease
MSSSPRGSRQPRTRWPSTRRAGWSDLSPVCRLCLDPPPGTVLVSIDEKTGIQAKTRTRPEIPARPGRDARREFECSRHGTVSIIAAMNVAGARLSPGASRGTTRRRSPASWRCWTSAPGPASGRVSLGSLNVDAAGRGLIGASRSTSVTTRSFRPDGVSESFEAVNAAVPSAGGEAAAGSGAAAQSPRTRELDCDGGDLGRVRLPAAWTRRWRRRPGRPRRRTGCLFSHRCRPVRCRAAVPGTGGRRPRPVPRSRDRRPG